MDVATMFNVFESYGFETDDEMTDDRKMEALNETYWDAASRNEWPFLMKSATLSFAGGQEPPPMTPATSGRSQPASARRTAW